MTIYHDTYPVQITGCFIDDEGDLRFHIEPVKEIHNPPSHVSPIELNADGGTEELRQVIRNLDDYPDHDFIN